MKPIATVSLKMFSEQSPLPVPPLPERTFINLERTNELSLQVIEKRKQPAHISKLAQDESLSVARALQSVVSLQADQPDAYHIVVQQVEESFTRLFCACSDNGTSLDIVCQLSHAATLVTDWLQEGTSGHVLGEIELAVDCHDRVYVALAFLRADGSVRGRLTCPVFQYQIHCTAS